MKTKMATMTIGLFLSAATVFGAEGDDRFYGGSYDGVGSAMMQHARALDGSPQVSFWSASSQVFDWTAGSATLATLSVAAWDTVQNKWFYPGLTSAPGGVAIQYIAIGENPDYVPPTPAP